MRESVPFEQHYQVGGAMREDRNADLGRGNSELEGEVVKKALRFRDCCVKDKDQDCEILNLELELCILEVLVGLPLSRLAVAAYSLAWSGGIINVVLLRIV